MGDVWTNLDKHLAEGRAETEKRIRIAALKEAVLQAAERFLDKRDNVKELLASVEELREARK